MDALRWFLVIMVILAVAWFSSGGLYSPSSSNPFIQPPAPISGGGTYGGTIEEEAGGVRGNLTQTELAEEVKRAQEQAEAIQEEIRQLESSSPLKGKLFITGVNAIGIFDTNEYVLLEASADNTAPVLLTGLILKSSITGRSVTIGTGAILPYLGVVNHKEAVYLMPGKVAYILTGRSPIGTSFQINHCIGYFEQYQDFEPSLPTECPRIENEPRPQVPNNLDDACVDYMESLPQCTADPTPPATLTRECQVFIQENTNYSACVNRYKNGRNFYDGEWRIYLGQSEPLWKERRETILLLDTKGKLIDAETY